MAVECTTAAARALHDAPRALSGWWTGPHPKKLTDPVRTELVEVLVAHWQGFDQRNPNSVQAAQFQKYKPNHPLAHIA